MSEPSKHVRTCSPLALCLCFGTHRNPPHLRSNHTDSETPLWHDSRGRLLDDSTEDNADAMSLHSNFGRSRGTDPKDFSSGLSRWSLLKSWLFPIKVAPIDFEEVEEEGEETFVIEDERDATILSASQIVLPSTSNDEDLALEEAQLAQQEEAMIRKARRRARRRARELGLEVSGYGEELDLENLSEEEDFDLTLRPHVSSRSIDRHSHSGSSNGSSSRRSRGKRYSKHDPSQYPLPSSPPSSTTSNSLKDSRKSKSHTSSRRGQNPRDRFLPEDEIYEEDILSNGTQTTGGVTNVSFNFSQYDQPLNVSSQPQYCDHAGRPLPPLPLGYTYVTAPDGTIYYDSIDPQIYPLPEFDPTESIKAEDSEEVSFDPTKYGLPSIVASDTLNGNINIKTRTEADIPTELNAQDPPLELNADTSGHVRDGAISRLNHPGLSSKDFLLALAKTKKIVPLPSLPFDSVKEQVAIEKDWDLEGVVDGLAQGLKGRRVWEGVDDVQGGEGLVWKNQSDNDTD